MCHKRSIYLRFVLLTGEVLLDPDADPDLGEKEVFGDWLSRDPPLCDSSSSVSRDIDLWLRKRSRRDLNVLDPELPTYQHK